MSPRRHVTGADGTPRALPRGVVILLCATAVLTTALAHPQGDTDKASALYPGQDGKVFHPGSIGLGAENVLSSTNKPSEYHHTSKNSTSSSSTSSSDSSDSSSNATGEQHSESHHSSSNHTEADSHSEDTVITAGASTGSSTVTPTASTVVVQPNRPNRTKPPGNPSACKFQSHKTPAVPHLPPKPAHPVTIHWEPNRRPAARPVYGRQDEARRRKNKPADSEIEPEFFGHEDDGVLASGPCLEETVTSDSGNTVSALAVSPGGSVSSSSTYTLDNARPQNWGTAVASSSSSSSSSSTTGPTASVLPVVTGVASTYHPVHDNDSVPEPYVLNMAGPVIGVARMADN